MKGCKLFPGVSLFVVVTVVLVLFMMGAASAATIVEYAVPTTNSQPYGIVAGPDGNLWFAEYNANKVGRITPSGTVTEYTVSGTGQPAITNGPDGALWFTEYYNNKVGRITTAGTLTNEFSLPSGTGPWGICAGPDGALWIAGYDSNKIIRMTTAGVTTEYSVPTWDSGPNKICAGPDGALWFTEFDGNKIGRITTAGVITNEYPLPGASSTPDCIITGPDGALWFTEFDGDKIGRITTSGTITNEYPLPAGSETENITIGPDGALWFAESGTNKIGRITTTGTRSHYSVPTSNSKPYGVITGPDGALWFTEWNGNKIGKFPASTPQNAWYLAEGTTAWGFSTYISIENPNRTAVHAAITYMTGSGNVSGGTITLPAKSQTVVNPADKLGSKDFSTRVVCTEGKTIAVDRTMSWTGPGAASPEGHSSVGVTSPAKTWYLPEGSSAWGFETWLLIQNPNAGAASCQVTYMIEGADPVTKIKTVPAYARQSFNMAEDIGSKDASIKVVSNVPVIPERAMYKNNRREGHDSIGTTAAAADYYLAEGTTAWGFTTYVLVQNPNASACDVTITYMTGEGAKPQASFSMDPNSRKTKRVNDVAGMGNTDFSTQVHGSKAIIAERAMYWDNGTGEACHDSIGMDQAHTTFYLPDGQTSDGRETWTLVQNPNGSAVSVEISYLKAGGGTVTFTDSIPANSRKTFNMADKLASGRASIMVTCKNSGKKIMVERAMYWNSRGAGADTIGSYSD